MSSKLVHKLLLSIFLSLAYLPGGATGDDLSTPEQSDVTGRGRLCFLAINHYQVDTLLLESLVELTGGCSVVVTLADGAYSGNSERQWKTNLDLGGSDSLAILLETIKRLRPAVLILPPLEKQPLFFRSLIERLLTPLVDLYREQEDHLLVLCLSDKEAGGAPVTLRLSDGKSILRYFARLGAYPSYLRPSRSQFGSLLSGNSLGQLTGKEEVSPLIVKVDDDLILLANGEKSNLTVSMTNASEKQLALHSIVLNYASSMENIVLNQVLLPYATFRKQLPLGVDTASLREHPADDLLTFTVHYDHGSGMREHRTSTEISLSDPIEVRFTPARLVVKSAVKKNRPDLLVRSEDVTVRFINNSSTPRTIRPRFQMPEGLSHGVFPKEIDLPPRAMTDKNLKLNLKLSSGQSVAKIIIYSEDAVFRSDTFDLLFHSSAETKTLLVSDRSAISFTAPFSIVSTARFCEMTFAELGNYDNLILCTSDRCIEMYQPLIDRFTADGGRVIYSLCAWQESREPLCLRDWSNYTTDTSATVSLSNGGRIDTLDTTPYLCVSFMQGDSEIKTSAVCRMNVADREIDLWWLMESAGGRRFYTAFDFDILTDDQVLAILLDMIEK